MKASTKFQFQILELSKKIKPITKAQLNWANKNCIDHFLLSNKNNDVTCTNCAHTYRYTMNKSKRIYCENCNVKIAKILITRQQKFIDWWIFAILDVVDNLQVIRYFRIDAFLRKGDNPRILCNEVSQLWIDQNGKFEIYSKVHVLNYYHDTWTGDFEIRNSSTIDKYDIKPYKIYPQTKFINPLKRAKFQLNKSTISPFKSIQRILKYSQFETLYKLDLINIFDYHSTKQVLDNWNSIKICIRNSYIIQDLSLWFDYIKLLNFFNKDVLNAKYICTGNVNAEHDRYLNKKKKIQQRIDLAKRITEIEEQQVKYAELKSKYFDIQIQDEEFVIKPLIHVKQFHEIGELHEHCLFHNSYYDKEDSLILAAYKNNEILETIEFSLKTYSVVQSHGFKNNDTEYHDKIIQIVENNTNKLQYISA